MYRVLKAKYEKTGEVSYADDGEEIRWNRVTWLELGVAKDMQEANEKFPRGRKNGYSHVLDAIGSLQ